MKKSLCCISLQLQEKGFKANTMTKTRFLTLERKSALSTISQRTLNNVHVAVNTFAFCASKGWNYRISSDLFPLATLPEANLSFDILPDKDRIYAEFKRGAEIIKKNNLRCSTHPDQFVVPASATKTVVEKSIVELKNHASIMDLFGLPQSYESPINIHMNCYKGNTKDIAKRFIDDQDAGAPEFKALRAKGEVHPIEQVGRDLRKMMSWVKSGNKDDYKEGTAARG